MTNEKLEWGPDEGAMPWRAAVAFAADKGDGWRLPTVPELVAQFDYDKGKPKSEGWKRDWYWSSSPGDSNDAWYVDFGYGSVNNGPRTSEYGARCVRSLDNPRDVD